jgi:hypothetical protein
MKSGNRIEQRGLAATRRSDDDAELVGGDVDGTIVDRQQIQAEWIVGLAHIANTDRTGCVARLVGTRRCCHAIPRSVQRISILPARRMSALNR